MSENNMILDRLLELSKIEQTKLAGWLALITINQELKSFSQKAITPFEREYLRYKKKPSDNWTIYIARSSGPIWSRYYQYHNMGFYEDSGEIQWTNDGLPVCNTQITTLGIGVLFAQVFTSSSLHMIRRFKRIARYYNMTRLWPIPDIFPKRLEFPLQFELSDEQADTIEQGTYHLLGQDE